MLLDNPHNAKRIAAFQHLRDIEFQENPTNEKLPVHVILGANEYAKIKTTQLRVGRQGEPVAELTRFGWALMSAGEDCNPSFGCLAVDSAMDYERMCTLKSSVNITLPRTLFKKIKMQNYLSRLHPTQQRYSLTEENSFLLFLVNSVQHNSKTASCVLLVKMIRTTVYSISSLGYVWSRCLVVALGPAGKLIIS